ncbi:MAG: hypothetical protein VX294_13800 [Candidatus Latescibacterota bacterium]|nr:hypothetical protein [Candidatus Latescibacterota bacterium]
MFGWFRPLLHLLPLVFLGCSSDYSKGRFEEIEDEAWKSVNRKKTGSDGIYVQATLRTFAYEIAQAYARAEKENLGQEQLAFRLKQLIHSYVDGTYPTKDGTDLNNLYLQYLVFVDPNFNPENPIERQKFITFRDAFVSRITGTIFDPKYPMFRDYYDERWGITLFDRLVFVVYLNGEAAENEPNIEDIGSRTFLVDEDGNRYSPSGTAGPYPYESDRPETPKLIDKAYYRVFFPNRKGKNIRVPIVNPETKSIELHIEGLGTETLRKLRWELPINYPIVTDGRRLPSEAELRAEKEAAKAERQALRKRINEDK